MVLPVGDRIISGNRTIFFIVSNAQMSIYDLNTMDRLKLVIFKCNFLPYSSQRL